jgi:hypothetical protein
MPRNETVISVFVASPSDVSEERKALESVTQELNKLWSKNLNLRLDLIKWETDVYPAFGNYPQDVINEQINDDYDVFIAIFWSKIGSQTQRADSGTIEEFNRAYKKYIADNDSIDIMIYFKDQPISPSKMDFEQLRKIKELKEQLGDKGGLYWTFDSVEDFETMLRGHLSRIAQKWSLKSSVDLTQESENTNLIPYVSEIISDEDEYGFLDYFEMFEERNSDMNTALFFISEATEKMAGQITRRTGEMSNIQNDSTQFSPKKIRKIIKLSSDDMDRYAETIESQIKILSISREEAFYALSKAVSVYVDFIDENEVNDFHDLENELKDLVKSINGASIGLSEFRETVCQLPRITIQLNKSKKRVTKALDIILEEIDATIESVSDVLRIIREVQ